MAEVQQADEAVAAAEVEVQSARQGSEALVQAQQKAMVLRASAQTLRTEVAADDLGLLVKRQRLMRLDSYAQKYRWSLDGPPAKAKERPEIGIWWSEWRDLRMESQLAKVPAP